MITNHRRVSEPNTRLRSRRERTPLSQAELAKRVGVALITVRRWEAGWRPQPEHVRRLCAVLKASPAQLGLGLGDDADAPEPVLGALLGELPDQLVIDTRALLMALGTVTPEQRSGGGLPPALHMTVTGETLANDMKRREFLHLLGVPAAVIVSGAGLSQTRWARADAGVPNEAILDELAAAIAAEKRLCDQLGSRAVQGLAAEHVRLATDLMGSSPPAALRPRLAALASEAAVEAGFVCADQGQLPAARSNYQLAAELAREAEDPRLEAFILGSWSRRVAQGSYYRLGAATSGDMVGALPYVERARVAAARCPSPATSVYLATVEAEVQACAGDADASLSAMERADEALSRREPGEDAPPWLAWMDAVEMRGSQGYCYMRMGRLEQADTLLTRTLSDVDPSPGAHALAHEEKSPDGRAALLWRAGGRGRITLARDLVILAFIRLRQREIEECCRLAGEALQLSVAIGASTNVQRVRDLRLELQPWKESAAVKALDEQMAAASWGLGAPA